MRRETQFFRKSALLSTALLHLWSKRAVDKFSISLTSPHPRYILFPYTNVVFYSRGGTIENLHKHFVQAVTNRFIQRTRLLHIAEQGRAGYHIWRSTLTILNILCAAVCCAYEIVTMRVITSSACTIPFSDLSSRYPNRFIRLVRPGTDSTTYGLPNIERYAYVVNNAQSCKIIWRYYRPQ